MTNTERPETQEPRKRKPRPQSLSSRIMRTVMKHLMIAGIAFVAAGASMVFLMDSLVMPILLKSGAEIIAPDLIGIGLEDAELTAASLGLRLSPESSEYNNQFPVNTIAFQYPYPGTKVKPGRRIQARVSLGARPIEMPDVVGKSRRDKRKQVRRAPGKELGWFSQSFFYSFLCRRLRRFCRRGGAEKRAKT